LIDDEMVGISLSFVVLDLKLLTNKFQNSIEDN